MLDEPLPKQADLRKLTSRDADFSSHLDVANLPRLSSAVHEGQGQIEVHLHCGVDEQHVRYIAGTAKCETSVICQRCLEPVAITFSADICLGVVWSEEKAQELPESMEPLILGEDELVNLNEVVEEELLLSFPFVSFHEDGECSNRQNFESSPAELIKPVEKENPFKVLEQLKTSKK